MKYKFYHFLVKTLLGVGDWFVYLGKGLGIFLSAIGQGLRAFFVALLPLVILIYRGGRWLRQKIRGFLVPARQRIFFLIAHRYLIHFLVLILVGCALVGSWQLWTNAAAPVGESSLLFRITGGGEDETFIDDGLPLISAPTTIDNSFFGLPPSSISDAPRPLSLLQDQSMMKIDVAPSDAFTTRTKPEEYIVASGDTISSIASKFNVSPNTILWENKMGIYDVIRPGQKLIILPTSGISYKVKKGDTIAKIAKFYGVSEENLIQFNGLFDETSISPNQILVIPGGRPYVAPAPKPSPAPAVVVTPRPAPNIGAGLLWPTAATRISQYFSWRHPGLDIAGPVGLPIYAMDDGTVTLTEKLRTGYGLQIMIDHGNGFKTRYGHASKILVKTGQQVKKGEVIALMGSTGRSTGPHLHFEIYAYGKRVNPLGYVKR